MKTLTITIETAVIYRDKEESVPGPTETAIPELRSDDLVLFQVRHADGRILLQLPISNYFEMIGSIDGTPVISELRNLHKNFRPEEPPKKKWPWRK